MTNSFVPVETIQNIITCWEGDEGVQLHHENGVKTEQLVPPHEYVPWVTFNDVSKFIVIKKEIFYLKLTINTIMYTNLSIMDNNEYLGTF